MSAILNALDQSIFQDILFHPSWLGEIAGISAEKMLRGKAPFSYVLRQGEKSLAKDVSHFYVTFVDAQGAVRHQPFTITLAQEGWYYEQGGSGGPFIGVPISDVVHMIIHGDKDQCKPFIP